MMRIQSQLEDKKSKESELAYNCNICNDVGFILKEGSINTFDKKCVCRIKKENQDRIINSGLDKLVKKYTFKNYTTDTVYHKTIKNTALKYLENIKEKKWFFIGGQTGVGKTHICTAICSELMKKGYSVKYVISNKLLMTLKSNMLDDAKRNEILNSLNKKVLYIDDLFKSRNVTDSDVKLIFDIVNDRANKELITIISSERKLQELEEDIDLEAIAGRIYENASEYVLNIGRDINKNYRRSINL